MFDEIKEKGSMIHGITQIKDPMNHGIIQSCSGRIGWWLNKYECLWGVRARAGVQVSGRKFHTHIHLD